MIVHPPVMNVCGESAYLSESPLLWAAYILPRFIEVLGVLFETSRFMVDLSEFWVRRSEDRHVDRRRLLGDLLVVAAFGMSDYYTHFFMSSIDLEAMKDRIYEEWRLDCNLRGVEIYYDLSEPVPVVHYDEDGEPYTSEIGQYKERPCTKHFEGHQCNPPRYAKITNLSVT